MVCGWHSAFYKIPKTFFVSMVQLVKHTGATDINASDITEKCIPFGSPSNEHIIIHFYILC